MITCSNCNHAYSATVAHIVACPACGHETFSPGLRCACCGVAMRADEAAPAPEGTPADLLFHADLLACVRGTLGRLGYDVAIEEGR